MNIPFRTYLAYGRALDLSHNELMFFDTGPNGQSMDHYIPIDASASVTVKTPSKSRLAQYRSIFFDFIGYVVKFDRYRDDQADGRLERGLLPLSAPVLHQDSWVKRKCGCVTKRSRGDRGSRKLSRMR